MSGPGGSDRSLRDDDDFDARFADIVAHWEDEAAPRPPRRPGATSRPGGLPQEEQAQQAGAPGSYPSRPPEPEGDAGEGRATPSGTVPGASDAPGPTGPRSGHGEVSDPGAPGPWNPSASPDPTEQGDAPRGHAPSESPLSGGAPESPSPPSARHVPGPGRTEEGPREPSDPRTWSPAEPEEEHFEPPRPAPPPRGDLTFWGALVCLVTGPLWLIFLVVVRPDDGRFPMILAIGLTIVGFVLIVMRSPRRRDPDDEDDGAVV